MVLTTALHGEKIVGFPSNVSSRKRLPDDELEQEYETSAANKKVRSKDYSFDKYAVSDKEEWVELMIKELMGVGNVDDAKSSAASLFDYLKEALAEAKKEKLEAMTRENSILKREVAMRHKKYKVSEEKMDQEVKKLKENVSKYEDQVKSLEQTNSFLTMHLGVATCLAF